MDYCVLSALKLRQFRSTDACMVTQFPNYVPTTVWYRQPSLGAHAPPMWYDLLPVDGKISSNSSAPTTILETRNPGVVFFGHNKWQKPHLTLFSWIGNDKVVINIGIHFSRKTLFGLEIRALYTNVEIDLNSRL